MVSATVVMIFYTGMVKYLYLKMEGLNGDLIMVGLNIDIEFCNG